MKSYIKDNGTLCQIKSKVKTSKPQTPEDKQISIELGGIYMYNST